VEVGTVRRSDDGANLEARPDGSALLRLAGRLPLGWCGALSLALSRLSIDIEHGSARSDRGRWEAQFSIRARDSGRQLERVPFLALAKGPRLEGPAHSGPQIDDYRLDPGLQGQAAVVEIYGADRLGFLGELLGHFAGLALFPEAMTITTVDGRVHDRFWLRAIGGLAPSPESLDALEASLADLVVGRIATPA